MEGGDGESVGLGVTFSDIDLALDTDVDTLVVPSEVTLELLVGAAMLLFGRKQTMNAATATEKSGTTMASIVFYVLDSVTLDFVCALGDDDGHTK